MVICNSEPNRWSAWFSVRTLRALNLSTLCPSETQLRMFWPVEGRHGQTPFRLQNPAWHLLPGVSVVFGPCPWSLWWSELGHLCDSVRAWGGLVTFVKLGNDLNPENSSLLNVKEWTAKTQNHLTVWMSMHLVSYSHRDYGCCVSITDCNYVLMSLKPKYCLSYNFGVSNFTDICIFC